MTRSPAQQSSFVLAALLGVAPTAFGLFRGAVSGSGFQMLWMALVATSFAAGVLAAAIGRRRGRTAVMKDALVILFTATLLAGATGYVLSDMTGPSIWAVSLAFGVCLAASSVGVAYARPSKQ